MAIVHRTIEVEVGPVTEAMRLDAYVVQARDGLSRSLFSKADTRLTLNGKEVKKSRLVKEGDRIVVTYTEAHYEGIVAQPIDLSVLYEDNDLLIIDKEQGVVVHPGAGNRDQTLVNGLLERYGTDFAAMGEEGRPGIVHRLDKDTSGVMVIALNAKSQRALSAQFKARTTEKVYVAVVRGRVKERRGTIESNIMRDPVRRTQYTTCGSGEGRTARTDYTVVARSLQWTLLRIVLHTGRTHQIRVHLKSIGHPIVGDPIYGSGAPPSLLLHALALGIDHPTTGVRIRAVAPLPRRIKEWVYGASAPRGLR
ncbi:MAG: RluA family pseudouridine synthase [Sphaerochaeta sp.]|jgi:23S rRNA pseudouridine1911/1915/1917 synthase|nr:RluA family pseudouridine synthase [Sphaerochaeta sp.]MDX9914344.1 RluA family pseudouridine synthase [Sphaerochaeta sp.]